MATDWTEISTGIRERRLDTGYCHVRVHYVADPEKNADWVRRHSLQYGGVQSPKWRREMEIDYTAIEGQAVYPMLCSDHLQIKSLDGMAVYRIIDHGIRHPMVCLWVAVSPAGDRHIFREYYRTGATIPVNCSEVLRRSTEFVMETYIDPATRQRIPLSMKDKAPVSILSLYNQCLGISVRLADNSFAGYDTVRNGLLSVLARKVINEGLVDSESDFFKTYFANYKLTDYELAQLASKPALTFSPDCVRAFQEMRNLRFRDVQGDITQKAQPEDVVDFEDDGPDCVRYAMQSKLSWSTVVHPQKGSPFWEIQQKRIKENNRGITRTG